MLTSLILDMLLTGDKQEHYLININRQDVLEEMGSSHMLLPYIMDSDLLIVMMMLMQEIFNDIPNLDSVFYCC